MATSGRLQSGVTNYTYFFIQWQRVRVEGRYSVISWSCGINISSNAWWGYNAVRIHSGNVHEGQITAGTWSSISGNGDHVLRSGETRVRHNANGSASFGMQLSASFATGGRGDIAHQMITLDGIGPETTAPSGVQIGTVKWDGANSRYLVPVTVANWGVGGAQAGRTVQLRLRNYANDHHQTETYTTTVNYWSSTYKEIPVPETALRPNRAYRVDVVANNGEMATGWVTTSDFITTVRKIANNDTTASFSLHENEQGLRIALTAVPTDFATHRGGWAHNRRLRVLIYHPTDNSQKVEAMIAGEGKNMTIGTKYAITNGATVYNWYKGTGKQLRYALGWSNNSPVNQTVRYTSVMIAPVPRYKKQSTLTNPQAKIITGGSIQATVNVFIDNTNQDGTTESPSYLDFYIKKASSSNWVRGHTIKKPDGVGTYSATKSYVFSKIGSEPLVSNTQYHIAFEIRGLPFGETVSTKNSPITISTPQMEDAEIINVENTNIKPAEGVWDIVWKVRVTNNSSVGRTFKITPTVVLGNNSNPIAFKNTTVPAGQNREAEFSLVRTRGTDWWRNSQIVVNVVDTAIGGAGRTITYDLGNQSFKPHVVNITQQPQTGTGQKGAFNVDFKTDRENVFGVGASQLFVRIQGTVRRGDTASAPFATPWQELVVNPADMRGRFEFQLPTVTASPEQTDLNILITNAKVEIRNEYDTQVPNNGAFFLPSPQTYSFKPPVHGVIIYPNGTKTAIQSLFVMVGNDTHIVNLRNHTAYTNQIKIIK